MVGHLFLSVCLILMVIIFPTISEKTIDVSFKRRTIRGFGSHTGGNNHGAHPTFSLGLHGHPPTYGSGFNHPRPQIPSHGIGNRPSSHYPYSPPMARPHVGRQSSASHGNHGHRPQNVHHPIGYGAPHANQGYNIGSWHSSGYNLPILPTHARGTGHNNGLGHGIGNSNSHGSGGYGQHGGGRGYARNPHRVYGHNSKASLTSINAAALQAIHQINGLDRAASYSFVGGGGGGYGGGPHSFYK